jgi:hypothetical protein
MRGILAIIAGLVLAAVFVGPAAAASGARPQPDVCGHYVARAEAVYGVPNNLLRAVSLVESGRWSQQHRSKIAWPWTVMAEGKGRYLPNREAAVAEVEALQAKGVRNIDVGCMQVNLYYHPKAFRSLHEAFDPATNVAYASNYLISLQRQQRSWIRAVGRYHSATPQLAHRYREKVLNEWRSIRLEPALNLRTRRNAPGVRVIRPGERALHLKPRTTDGGGGPMPNITRVSPAQASLLRSSDKTSSLLLGHFDQSTAERPQRLDAEGAAPASSKRITVSE